MSVAPQHAGSFLNLRKLLAWTAIGVLAAFTGAASAQIVVSRTSHTLLLADDAHSQPHLCNYAAYRISPVGALADVWATIGNFAGGRITLAATEDGVVHVGAIGAGGYGMAYFYLCGDTVPNIGEVIGGQTHTLTLWDRDPALPGATQLATPTDWTLSYAHAHINASANKIDLVTIDPPDPVLGQTFTIRVDGRTGTVGDDEHLVFSPAVHAAWPAGKFELVAAYIDLPDVGPDTHILVDELVHTGLAVNSANTPYFAIYTFRVTGPTTASTQVSPYAFIDSGQNLKHTDVSHVVYPDIPPTPNPATLTKSANPTLVVQSGSTTDITYTVTINNSDDHAITLDEIRDVLPPTGFAYLAGSTTYNGSPIGDPFISGGGLNLAWVGSFPIPAQSSRTLVFHATLQATPAIQTYDNCATARIEGTQIDLTADTTDNAPACARVTVIGAPTGGAIVVQKTTIGGGASFSYTATPAPPLANFVINASAGSGTQTFSSIAGGTYTITESVPGGWTLTSINCVVTLASPTGAPTSFTYTGAAGGTTGFEPGDTAAVVVLGSGAQVQCNFVNTRLGSITIAKEATPEVGQAFTFTSADVTAPFDLTPPGTPQQAFTNLAAGTYSVAELVPAGWTLTGIECSITLAGSNTTSFAYLDAPSGDTNVFQPGDRTARITLGAGDDVRCVFSDAQNGSIAIVKQSLGGDGLFGFDTDGSPGSAELTITTVGGTGNGTAFASAAPGIYAIHELASGNWRLTSIVCTSAGGSEYVYLGSQAGTATQEAFDTGDDTAEINLAAGDAVTCTFTNALVPEVPVPTLSETMLMLLAALMLGAGVLSLLRAAPRPRR